MLPYLTVFGIHIPMYGLLMAVGVALAFFVAWRRTKWLGLDGNDLLIVGACALGLGLLCGQLLFAFTAYTWSQIVEIVRAGQIGLILNGGIVFYGGLIGGVLGGLLGCAIAKASFVDFLYAILPTVPLGHAVGRIGCFCAGCCYGCETTLPIGVVYTNPIGGAPTGVPLLPVQLIEALLNLILFAALMLYEKKYYGKHPRLYLACIYGIGYAIIRFVLEFMRYDSIRGFAMGLSTSQWISILILVVCLGCMLGLHWRRKKA